MNDLEILIKALYKKCDTLEEIYDLRNKIAYSNLNLSTERIKEKVKEE